MAQHFTIPAAKAAPVGTALAFRIVTRDAYACVYCGVAGVALTVDHVRPQSHFGVGAPNTFVNAPSNLVAACSICNGAKGPQNLLSFAAMLRGRGIHHMTVKAMLARVAAATSAPCP